MTAIYADSVVIDTTKVRLFKQITTQAKTLKKQNEVVIDTTKVRLFKQITTELWQYGYMFPLLLIPQR